MTTSLRFLGFAFAFSLFAVAAGAQTPPPTSQTTPSEDASRRPATTTFHGDTGLWFVPTAEVLAHGKWSVTGYRRGTNYIQGYTNVGDFAGTFAVGIRNRVELFTSFLFDTRIDRDVRPIFVANNTEFGSFADRYPRVNRIWTGDNVGDWFVGGKVNFLAEAEQDPLAVAIRGVLKLPTGDDEIGTSTGATDFFVDFIGSKDVSQVVEVSAYAGYEWRGEPDGFETPGGAFRWGGGLGFPTRSPLRVYTELTGSLVSDDTASQTVGLVGVDGSVAPLQAETSSQTRVHFGLNYQHQRGFFIGTGLAWNLPKEERVEAFSEGNDSPFGDYWDWQVRVGYHPGARVYVPPPPPPAAAAAAGARGPQAGRRRDGQTADGGNRATLDGDGDGAELDQLRGDVSVERAERHVCGPDGARDGVDGGAGRGDGAGDGDGDVPDRQADGGRYGQHRGDAADAESVRV